MISSLKIVLKYECSFNIYLLAFLVSPPNSFLIKCSSDIEEKYLTCPQARQVDRSGLSRSGHRVSLEP